MKFNNNSEADEMKEDEAEKETVYSIGNDEHADDLFDRSIDYLEF